MRVSYFIILLFFSKFSLLAQNIPNNIAINLCQLNLEIYKDSIPTILYGFSSSNNFLGDLGEGVSNLFGSPVTRLKTSKNSNIKYIKYNVFRSYGIDELERVILKTLEKECQFTINDIHDTCDVWRIFVADSTKLDTFSWLKDSPNGTTWCNFLNNGKDRDYFGQTFTALTQHLEEDSRKYIFSTDSDDSADEPKRYKFVIPIKFLYDIELLKPFMKEKYGIALIKEQKVIKKIYLKFKDSD